jgi:hypothetical protein
VLTVDRYLANAVVDDRGRRVYQVAREPGLAAELLISLRMGASLVSLLPGLAAIDVAIVIGAAPKDRLVSSERAVDGGRFGEPHDGIEPSAEVPSHHTDGDRFELNDAGCSRIRHRMLPAATQSSARGYASRTFPLAAFVHVPVMDPPAVPPADARDGGRAVSSLRRRNSARGPSAIVTTHTALPATIAKESRSSSGIQAARWH